jgi:ABC-2 type transport system permease protein
MQGFPIMLKTNLKLLLRNKGYLAFLVILPILSVILLNINNGDSMFGQDNPTEIKEMSKENDEILNLVNTRLSVKVYDCSNTGASDYIVNELVKTGSFTINRYKSEAFTMNEVREKALYSANHNSIGAIIYIPEHFEEDILEGKESDVVVFEAAQDGRIELLKSNLEAYLQSIYRYAAVADYDKDALSGLLKASGKNQMVKDYVNIEVGDTLNLTTDQKAHSSSMGYSLSFLSIAFLFSGVFIASTVVEERQNRVYNRFVLSTSSIVNYGLVKLLLIFITVILQTGIIALGIKLMVRQDFGISFANFLFLVFCLGLIFNLLSVVIGVVADNILISNYFAFLIWCISCLLAGLYFPLDGASKWLTNASLLMPQRWVVKAAELLMLGKSDVYTTFLLVVASYIILIMSVGMIGLKIRRKD